MARGALREDLDRILAATEDIWRSLRGARIFITGGTGFIGCWLLESLRHANQTLGVNARATVLTRNPQAFASKCPHLAADPSFEWMTGDVCDFAFGDGEYSHVIHGATDASAHLNEHNPVQMFRTIVDGTRRVLEFAADRKVPRVLFMSSGAVYGQQPWEMTNVPESWLGAPNCVDPRATYAEAKRAAEMLCAIYAKQFGVHVAIARIFALLGPYLSLDIHFAAGNFIRDAMAGKKVIVNGNGLPCRSYLYASDLTVWLWTMLEKAPSVRPYNVGSEESISVGELAKAVSTTLANGDCEICGAHDMGWNLGRYVPDTQLIRHELGVSQTVSLEDAIRKTALWNGWEAKK